MSQYTAYVDWTLLYVTNIPLFLLWLLSLKHVCNTPVSDKRMCHRTVAICLFCSCSFTINVLNYFSLVSDDKFPSSSNLCIISLDAAAHLIGFHIFCLFYLSIIDGFHSGSGHHRFHWIRYIFYCLELFITATIITCYTLYFAPSIGYYSFIVFYIIYGVIILSQSLLVLIQSQKILKILSSSTVNVSMLSPNSGYSSRGRSVRSRSAERVGFRLISAKRTLRGIKCVFILISIICIVDLTVNFLFIANDEWYKKRIPSDVRFWNHVLKSLFMITLMTLLISWIYQKDSSWYQCRPDSICCRCLNLCGCTLSNKYCCRCCDRKMEMFPKAKDAKYHDQFMYKNLSLETTSPIVVPKRTTGEMDEMVSSVVSTMNTAETTLSHSESVTNGSTLLMAGDSVCERHEESSAQRHSL